MKSVRVWRYGALFLSTAILVSPVAAQTPEWLSGRNLDGWNFGGEGNEDAWFSRPSAQSPSGPTRMWFRTENKIKNEYTMGSFIELIEFNCIELKYRVVQATIYTEHDLKGASTMLPSGDWFYALPRTRGERMVDRACKGADRRIAPTSR
jgi:hypothetical protein